MSVCESCHAGCCRSFAVPLTGADIIRIEGELGLRFWDFACRWADPDGKIALNYAPHFHFSDEPETPFVISLIHSESTYFSKTAKCRFLTEGQPDAEHPLGVSRCGIYKSRPSACRAFPTKLNETNELVIIHDVPDRGRSGDEPVYNLCSRQWEPADVDGLEMFQDLVVTKYEMEFFHKLAGLWNRSPRAWSVFPDFLHIVYSSRVMLESEQLAHSEPATIKLPIVDREQAARAA